MDRLETIKETWEDLIVPPFSASISQMAVRDIEYLISEVERLRTVEQAYQALLSVTAGLRK